MNRKKTLLLGAMIVACSMASVAGVTAAAETVSLPAPKTTNIVKGLSADAFSATDYSGNEISAFVGHNVGAGRTYTLDNLNNGDKSSWDVIVPSVNGKKSLGWVKVDLGDTYTVDKMMVTMNHDWSGKDVVIQLATQADFSDAITIYNNDSDNSLNCGATFTGDASVPVGEALKNFGSAGASLDENGNYFSFTPVAARYVRVTNNQYGDGSLQNFTAVGEIEVYAYDGAATPADTTQVAPVAFSLVEGSYSDTIAVELSSEHANADIYYTTDGSVPTTDSEKYTGAITVQKGYSKMIRASAYVNGVMGLPVTAEYVVQDEMIGKNVALNKPVKVVSKDMTQDWSDNLYAINKPTEAGANAVTRINDGSFDMWYAISTHNQAALGWAVIDFGAEYYIDYVVYEAYWDWWMGNNIIEISTTENFTAETTVRIYDNAGGLQTGVASGNKGMQIDANVKGRYLRVTNDKEGGGTISAFTEIQAIAGKEPEAGSLVGTNVALNKDIKFVSYDMSADWSDNLYAINKSGEAGANTVGHINDGSFDFWYALTSQKAGGKGWAIIDLGAEYYLDYLVYDAYHDWDIGNHIIKVASNADYSDAVTIHNNEGTYRTGGGKQIDANVKGRYILVSNAVARGETENVEATVLTEIQAFVGEEPSVSEQLYLASYDTFASFTVENGTAWEDLGLPTSLTVTMSDGSTKTLAGSCTPVDGYVGNAGTYTTTFVVEDKDALLDAYGIYKDIEISFMVRRIMPTLSVEIAEKSFCDGNAPAVTVTSSMEDYTVKFYKGALELDAAPTEAGTYKVIVSIAETENNEGVFVEKTFMLVDNRPLKALIASTAAFEEADYLPTTWAAFESELEVATVIANSTEATQTQLDLSAADLQSAIDGLEAKGDKSALQAKYDELKNTQNVYTKASWMKFTEAIAEVEALLKQDYVSEADVTEWTNALTAAHSGLVAKADFSALEAAFTEANALDLDGYVTAGKAAFTEALTAAEAVLANDETAQNDINAAKTALEAAQAALTAKGNKSALLNSLQNAIYAPTNYTATTYNAYMVAKEGAEAVLADDEATQAAVDEAKTALEAAIAGLKKLGNKTALKNAIMAAEAVTKGNYTQESWTQFTTVVEYAKSVSASNDVTQEQVDEAAALLAQAQSALTENDEGGCGSTVAVGALAAVTVLGTALLLKKKKENE